MAKPILVNCNSSNGPNEIVINKDKFSIGRGLQSDFVFDDISISRIHCIIEEHDNDWVIVDKSSNGTLINGNLLGKLNSRVLSDGDIITLAENIKFRFVRPKESNKSNITEEEILNFADEIIAEVEAAENAFGRSFEEEFSTPMELESVNSCANTASGVTSDKPKPNENSVDSAGSSKNVASKPNIIHLPKYFTRSSVRNGRKNPSDLCSNPDSLESGTTSTSVSPICNNNKSSSPSDHVDDPSMLSVDVKKMEDEPKPSCSTAAAASNKIDFVEDELQCSICTEMFLKAMTLSCSHTFCKYCIEEWRKKKVECPICRSPIRSLFPTLVIDKFIEKIIENADEETKSHRAKLIADREAQAKPNIMKRNRRKKPPATASVRSTSASSTSNSNSYSVSNLIEISSDSDTDEMDSDMEYPDSDWDENDDYDYDDDYEYVEYNGIPGAYYGGYGHCYRCGERGHWARGCPNNPWRR